MTVKQFFKGTAFKCLISLLCVLLVCGVFLTVMNSLLAVSAEERFERAIGKIYGKPVRTEVLAVENYNTNANIEEAYKIRDDGNYLIKSIGFGGFDNGTVTCWVVVELSGGSISGIGKVLIDSNERQSYIDRVSASALNQFGELYESGIYYTQDLITNATVANTKTAICNAVNGAVDFVNAKLGNVTEDPYKDFDYIANIQTVLSSHIYNAEDPIGESVIFTVVSSGYGHASNFTSEITVNVSDGTIRTFEVTACGSTGSSFDTTAKNNVAAFIGKDLDGILAILGGNTAYPGNGSGAWLEAGASESTYSLYNAALFATANYEKCVPAPDEEGGEE